MKNISCWIFFTPEYLWYQLPRAKNIEDRGLPKEICGDQDLDNNDYFNVKVSLLSKKYPPPYMVYAKLFPQGYKNQLSWRITFPPEEMALETLC